MKEYLDMQVEEKRRTNQFEKSLDYEQARIWKIDTNKFYEQEKEVVDQVIYYFLFYKYLQKLINNRFEV